MVMEANGEFAGFAQDEATALVKLLEGPGRKVMVCVVAVEAKGDGFDIAICRAASADTSRREADALLEGLDLHGARIIAKMEK